MRSHGLDLLAVYHSHPTSPPVPSHTDLERHGMEEVICLIVSLADDPPTVRRLVADGPGLSRSGVGDNGVRLAATRGGAFRRASRLPAGRYFLAAGSSMPPIRAKSRAPSFSACLGVRVTATTTCSPPGAATR